MTQGTSEVNEASSRHWLYGFNVALLAVVAVVILGFLLGLTNKYSFHRDMTSAGLYSLSGSTHKLLLEINEKKQTYELLNFFVPGPSEPAAERAQRVTDELDEYARQSPYIKVQDDAYARPQADVQNRIKSLYAGELQPYEQTIGEFDKLGQDVENFLKEEAANVGAIAQKPGTPQAAVRQAAELQGNFGTTAPDSISAARRGVRKAMEDPLPQWSSEAASVKQAVDGLATQLAVLADPKKSKDLFEPAIASYFVSAAPRFKAIVDRLKAYEAKLDKLPELKVEAVLNALGPDTVLVLGPASAKVISRAELFSPGPASGGSAPPSDVFTGEQGISSALMSMLQPEKVKVVFVSPSPDQLTTGLYGAASAMLRDSNFDVMEWSPPGPPQGPDQPPQNPNPPAEGKGVVWIVFPPSPPNQQMMMMGMPPPDPRPVIDATRKHMADGGQVMFLADSSGGGFMAGAGYAYQELLKDFGVDVQTKYTIAWQREMQDPDTGEVMKRLFPMVVIDQFPDTQITAPLQSLPLIVAPVPGKSGYIGMPTVVALRGTMPADASGVILLTTPKSSDYWGESDFKEDATFDKTQDYAPPCPIAVAATRFPGQKDKEQRVVVVGSSSIAADPLLNESELANVGGQPQLVARFPGNGEFFRNSVLWLAGYENMIAVSTKASVAMRIGNISPAALNGIRWGILFGGAPIAALLIGGFVWFARRR